VVSWRPARNRLSDYADICAVYDGVTRAGGRDLMPRNRGRFESTARAFVRPAVQGVRRKMLRPRIGHVRFGDLRRTTPIARDFGFGRGGPVDRHYIEAFLEKHRADVRGRVLAIGDDWYTRLFGGDHVTTSDVLHVNGATPGATFGGDLADGSFLPTEAFDCLIFTQTLHLIYDFPAALRTIERILAPGGVLLMTVPGISNIDPDEWGSTWHYQFTQHSVQRMCAETFPMWEVELASHGNILSVIAFLHGLGVGELTAEELAYHEPEYSLTHTARVVKPVRPT
jgi:SAM-dependent methyltransferase